MSGHLDDDYLSAPAVAACFNAEAMSRHMLAFEAALAAVGGELGVIPPAAVSVIARCADRFVPDYLALREATVAASNPAIPLVAALTAAVAAEDPEAARYVHWGATSQDVMDTATMLAARAAGVHLERELERVCALLSALADRHRATLLAARTLAQLAGPTTFGLRAAGWLAGLAGAQARLRALLPRLPVQCGGACGTLAAFGDAGAEVPARLAGRLGLAPSPPWHTERGMVRELAATLADICEAAGKVGS
ncbi:MAG: lyase family protein, partial [Gammaproteobacteria bacterium]